MLPQCARHQRRREQLAEARRVAAHRGVQREGADQRQRIQPCPPCEHAARRAAAASSSRRGSSSAISATPATPGQNTEGANGSYPPSGKTSANSTIGASAAAAIASPRRACAARRGERLRRRVAAGRGRVSARARRSERRPPTRAGEAAASTGERERRNDPPRAATLGKASVARSAPSPQCHHREQTHREPEAEGHAPGEHRHRGAERERQAATRAPAMPKTRCTITPNSPAAAIVQSPSSSRSPTSAPSAGANTE